MKLAASYKNNSNDAGAISPELADFLQQSLDGVNALVRRMKSPVAVIVTKDGGTAFHADSIRPHLQTMGVTDGELYRACLKKPDNGHARVVYLAPFGSGAVDVLIENAEAIIEPEVPQE